MTENKHLINLLQNQKISTQEEQNEAETIAK